MKKPRSCVILQPQALFNYPAGETMLPVSMKPEELEPASAASLVLRAWKGGLCVRHSTTPLHCAHPAPKHGRKVKNRELPIPSFSSWSRRCCYWYLLAQTSQHCPGQSSVTVQVWAQSSDLSLSSTEGAPLSWRTMDLPSFGQSSRATQPERWRIISDLSHKSNESLIGEYPNFDAPLPLYHIRVCFLRSSAPSGTVDGSQDTRGNSLNCSGRETGSKAAKIMIG